MPPAVLDTPSTAPRDAAPATPALAARYLDALVAGDRREAFRIVLDEGLGRGVSVKNLHLDVIQPAQREVGRLWEENLLSVAEEHLATAISQLVMAHLYPHLPRRPANGRRVVVACVEGELHDVGARMGADFLEMAGYEVRFLGANVPTDSLVDLVVRERPDALGLSVVLRDHAPAALEVVAQAREALGSELAVLLGGPGVDAGLAAAAGASVFGARADELVDAFDAALGGRP